MLRGSSSPTCGQLRTHGAEENGSVSFPVSSPFEKAASFSLESKLQHGFEWLQVFSSP